VVQNDHVAVFAKLVISLDAARGRPP
jgi:hypothetical protein